MGTIWKYELPVHEHDPLVRRMPVGARILDVQAQHEVPVLWALVDPDQPVEDRYFYHVGTGHPMPDVPLVHRGSYQLLGGNFVGHVFEELREPFEK